MKQVLGKRWWTTAGRLVLLVGMGAGLALLIAIAGFPLTTAGIHPAAAKGTHAAQGANAQKGVNPAQKTGLHPYTVKTVGTTNVNQTNHATAACDPGDRATGGGFEGVDLSGTQVIDSSPFTSIDDPSQPDAWSVVYTNNGAADPVYAIVVCTDKKPKHT